MMVNSSVLAYIFAGKDREQVSLTEVFMPFVFYAAFCLTLAAAFNLASHEAVDVDLGAVGERLGELLLDEFDGDLGEITCEITTATLESFVANFQRPCSAIRRKLVRHYDAEVVRKGAFLCRLYCKTKNAAHESLLRQFSRMRMRDQCEPWILNDRAKSGARPGFWTSLLPRTVRFYDGALPLGVMAEQFLIGWPSEAGMLNKMATGARYLLHIAAFVLASVAALAPLPPPETGPVAEMRPGLIVAGGTICQRPTFPTVICSSTLIHRLATSLRHCHLHHARVPQMVASHFQGFMLYSAK